MFFFRFSTSSVARNSGDHVKYWSAEKIVSVLNFPAIGIPFVYTTPYTDAVFCTVLVLHFYWGKIWPYSELLACSAWLWQIFQWQML